MALVVKNTTDTILATDPNQYHDLLTGVMTDQPVTLHYAPGVAGSPVLTLKTDGNVDLLRGYEADGTTVAFDFTPGGNLSLAGNLTAVAATLSGTLTLSNGTVNGMSGAGLIIGSAANGDIHINAGTNNWVYLGNQNNSHVDNAGNITATSYYNGTDASYCASVVNTGLTGATLRRIFVGPTQPTGAVKGDVWLKTSFA